MRKSKDFEILLLKTIQVVLSQNKNDIEISHEIKNLILDLLKDVTNSLKLLIESGASQEEIVKWIDELIKYQ